MCTFNGSKYLDEQINSILSQDYSNVELIVVDDCSTDDTWYKLETWVQKNNRVKIYRNENNIGYNKNFEKAISLATGDLIAISDQDDIWLPSKISKQVKTFNDANVMLSHTRSVRLENNRLRYKSASLHRHFNGNDTRKLFMFNQINGHDMMFRKSLVEKVLPIPVGIMYDWWIAVTATCYGSIASVNEFLVHHRIHSSNSVFTTKSFAPKTQLDLPDALKIFLSIPNLNNESKTFLRTLTQLLDEHHHKQRVGFDLLLFKFLYANRKTIFGHKKKMFSELAMLKYAYKYAKKDYRGKGVMI